uniref:EGF-like domain-containing protein n=1 Tax=Globisporangium ultimum (strain ATCC 200006 / CBS 805.95 / DAOM BR144) TaxID=431595 RepID=K3W8H4_GLOUD
MRKWCLWVMAMALLVAPVLGACPNKCSGHGRCGINDVCECMQNWVGGDCSLRLCSFTRAWQDTAEGDDDAHYYQECANRGVCDREKGVCGCDPGFTGSGCRRMVCPDDCGGHGACDFIEELAVNSFDKRIGGVVGRKYTLWDQEKIMGCKCDPGYEGHNCARRTCPKGDDPLTPNQYDMVQAIQVDSTVTVEGYLTYFDPYGNAFTTGAISFDVAPATMCANIQAALRKLPNNVLNTVTHRVLPVHT